MFILKRGLSYIFVKDSYETNLKKKFRAYINSEFGIDKFGIVRNNKDLRIDSFYIELYEEERDTIGSRIPDKFEFYDIEVNYVDYKFIK